ncbi:MAG: hypothetical protein ACYSOK_05275, partial [Planctomycetota bacterium]
NYQYEACRTAEYPKVLAKYSPESKQQNQKGQIVEILRQKVKPHIRKTNPPSYRSSGGFQLLNYSLNI